MTDKYNNGLDKTTANYAPLTPLSFLQRSAAIFPHKPAVIDDEVTLSYQDLYHRCCAMARALGSLGVGPGDTVAVLGPNGCELLESHYSVPMAGAVLNALNTRLDAAGLRFILQHGEARVLIYDTEFEALIRETVTGLKPCPQLVSIERNGGRSNGLSQHEYGSLLLAGAAAEGAGSAWRAPADEWDAISLNYTSGTTGNPKGVVYHHRGAYLAAMSNAMAFDMNAWTVYLWTLPMFHCNGWGYTWAITAVGGTHICLRKLDTDIIYEKIERYGVTHLCGAPIVLNMLLNDLSKKGKILSAEAQFALGGAAPPSAVIARAESIGFAITHLYGLTETYGPATLCVPQPEWASLPDNERARKMARQGVRSYAVTEARVRHRDSNETVASDGQTLGEIQLRGNTLMKGYLKNPETTEAAFAGGWFNTGDLAVVHPDGYIEIKDRSKDIIISGGENISSLEVEEVLYQHPAVSEAAVVAIPDETWGEVPCAFVNLINDDGSLTEQDLIDFCRERMAHFKAPKKVVIGELPKTVTGKIRKNVLRAQFIQQ
jgi:fatty-acyl-CoA synthase